MRFTHITLFFVFAIIFSGCEKNTLTSINLSDKSFTMKPGDSYTLTLSSNSEINQTPIAWKSSDESIATVFYGIVSAKKQGSVVITASVGAISDSCVITVKLPDYQLVWSEEFDSTALDSKKWNIETGTGNWGWGNGEAQNYTARNENLRIENGDLIIEAKKEEYQSSSYTSARINTKNKVDFAYGRIEARISLPAGTGTWPAFWMLGYGSWPSCGEIDIMEHIGSNPTMISHAVHTSEKSGGNAWSSRNYKSGIEGSYHLYAIEWENKIDDGDDCINFYVDGELTATKWEAHNIDDVRKWPFNQNFYIILNLALGGTMGGTIDDAIFDNPVLMKVDYVRVYQRK